tara:strand:- start:168 stop:404 length:237 start_codon:yes stop_codon:yes gene_type:complete
MPKSKAEVVEIKDLAKEIETVKDVHLAHIHECIHRVEDELKSNKEHFNTRIDRLDNRIFWVLGLTVTTLASVIANMVM